MCKDLVLKVYIVRSPILSLLSRLLWILFSRDTLQCIEIDVGSAYDNEYAKHLAT